MSVINFWHELVRRNSRLAYVGLVFWICFFICIAIAPFDSRLVAGLNPWIKPMKFFISSAIYAWTFGWILFYLKGREQTVSRLSLGIAVSMGMENTLISMQAARGVSSHFNLTTLFDGVVFSVMGIFILLNTVIVIYTTWLFFKDTPSLSTAYLLGLRWGLVIFVFASLVGGVMTGVVNSRNVGVPMGGEGVPFLNWSVKGGDLRVAHFIGMHAIQVLPIAGYVLDKKNVPSAKWLMLAAGMLFAAAVVTVFVQAMLGRPFVAG
jgi:hypothetical protein